MWYFLTTPLLFGGLKINPPNFFSSLPHLLQIGEIAIFLVRVEGIGPSTSSL